MLKINLLVKEKKKRLPVKGDFCFFLVVLVLVVGICGGTSWWLGIKLDALRVLEKEKLTQKKQLQRRIARVRRLKKDVEGLQQKIEAIRKIRERQNLPVIYIDEVVKAIPENKLWYESFSLSSSGDIMVQGVALDNQVLAFYIENLKRSPYVKQVEILLTNRKKVGPYELVDFKCHLVMGKTS
ncbi:PilN domain-containing protein [Desulfonauticus submarinus]